MKADSMQNIQVSPHSDRQGKVDLVELPRHSLTALHLSLLKGFLEKCTHERKFPLYLVIKCLFFSGHLVHTSCWQHQL